MPKQIITQQRLKQYLEQIHLHLRQHQELMRDATGFKEYREVKVET